MRAAVTAALRDKLEIQELIARDSHAIDSGDYDAWVELFAGDGAFARSRVGRFVGRAELRQFTEQFEVLRRTTLRNVRHCVTNTLTQVDGDRARLSSYLQVLSTGQDGPKLVFCGRYEDAFVMVDGKWRFKERRVVRDEVPP